MDAPQKLDPTNMKPPKAPDPFVAAVPAKLPAIGDRVMFVLRPIGSGIRARPKVRAAVVTEDWGAEKHPTGRVRGPDGKDVAGEDGKAIMPAGCVNLEIHLDGHARRDLNDGHMRYEGDVLYDPKKGHRTWHWPGE